jgi:Phage-related terminase
MWHDDDLAGRLMQKMQFDDQADVFEVVRYPAIAEHYEYRHRDTKILTYSDTPIKDKKLEPIREPNEPLHAERYDLAFLERVRANAPARVWSALYQQDPVPREGLFFKADSFHIMPQMPTKEFKRYYIAWDFAISEKQRADYTVGVCVMQDELDNLILVDMVRFQGDSHRICNEFISMIQRWSNIPGSSISLGVEDGQIWKSLKNMLRAAMREEKAYVSVNVQQALTDKLSRASELQGRMEMRRMWYIEGSPWWKDTQRELQRFPAGKNDDIVDALSWAVRLASGKKPKRAPRAKPIKSWKDNLGEHVAGAVGRGGGHMAA